MRHVEGEPIDRGVIPHLHVRDIEQDPDLNTLHDDPRFVALVAHARERAAAQKAN